MRVAIAGVGGCASSFAQFTLLASMDTQTRPAGVMFPDIHGYSLSDVSIVLGFDVDETKTERSFAEALDSPNIAALRHVDVSALSHVPVVAAPVSDGIEGPLSNSVTPSEGAKNATWAGVIDALETYRVDVLVITLPTGSDAAVRMYVDAALAAGVSVVNATPARVARDTEIVERFRERGIVALGDDLRSHIGATTLHTALAELLLSRGLEIKSTMQLNVGGNSDFLNLTDPRRADSKFESKANALHAAGIVSRDTGAGPTGFVGHLGDTKVCYLNIDAESVLGSRLVLDVKLQVEDSPNAAGVLATAVRAAKSAIDLGVEGTAPDACALLFKSAPLGMTESEGLAAFHRFLG